MENIILKNQKQLHQNLPIPQLGSRFTKLTNRFASKSNHALHLKTFFNNDHFTQSTQIYESKENANPTKAKHNRALSTLQESQLQYFKQVNTQIKQQNQNLKEDLKISIERLGKALEEKKKSDQKLLLCHKTINRSQKKINSLMELAHHLVVMVKDKLFTSEKNDSQDQSNLASTNSNQFLSPLEMKKLSMEREIQKIQQLTQHRRNSTDQKKKTIELMIEQDRITQNKPKPHRFTQKSIFYSKQSTKIISERDKKTKNSIEFQQEALQPQQQQINEIMNSLQTFEKDDKQLKVLQRLMEGITLNFNEQSQNQSSTSSLYQNPRTCYVLDQIGSFFTKLISKQQVDMHSSCKINPQIINQKVKPTYTSYRLYASIKQIFDHQIYLLQNQKMLFLQYKNKRMLKFIYECSGCQRYEEMFNEVFRILREGFKQIKFKIMPELKNKQDNDIEILL